MAPAVPSDAAHWRPWQTFVVFAVAGPLLGMLAVATGFAITMGLQIGIKNGSIMLLGGLNPIAWIIAYAIGGVPAAGCGAAFVLIDQQVPPRVPRIALAAATGGMLTAAYWWLAVRDSSSPTAEVAALAGAGAFAAGSCAVLTRRWRHRHA